jgi:choice-of-anchor B domain-containing protein
LRFDGVNPTFNYSKKQMKKLILPFLLFLTGATEAQVYQSLNMNLQSNWYDSTVIAEPAYGIKYNGIWGYEANGREYALVGSTAGVYFIDITNPQNPIKVDFVSGRRAACIWREIKTYRNYAYLISDDQSPNSFQIVDLQFLPDSVHVVADYTTLFERGHTLYVDGNKLYVGIARGGQFAQNASMAVFSLNNPEAPAFLRSINDDYLSLLSGNQVHDMFVRNDTIYASCGYDGLFIFKYDSVANQFQLINSLTSYPSQGYNHSSALADNGTLVFMDEVPSGLPVKLLDVNDVQNLTVTTTFSSNPIVTPHNPFVIGNICYIAYYMDGLQIYDVSDPYNPIRTAYFDTHNQESLGGPYSSLAYQGAWGAYPFFSSGNIAVSDMQNGLFVLNQSASGLNDLTLSQAQVYPNPAISNQQLTIADLKNGLAMVVEIYDVQGNLVLSNTFISTEKSVDIRLPEIASGLYLLKLSNGIETISKKLVIR